MSLETGNKGQECLSQIDASVLSSSSPLNKQETDADLMQIAEMTATQAISDDFALIDNGTQIDPPKSDAIIKKAIADLRHPRMAVRDGASLALKNVGGEVLKYLIEANALNHSDGEVVQRSWAIIKKRLSLQLDKTEMEMGYTPFKVAAEKWDKIRITGDAETFGKLAKFLQIDEKSAKVTADEIDCIVKLLEGAKHIHRELADAGQVIESLKQRAADLRNLKNIKDAVVEIGKEVKFFGVEATTSPEVLKQAVAAAPNANYIDIRRSENPDALMGAVKNMTRLDSLFAHEATNLSDRGLEQIKDMKNLERLGLGKTAVTDAGMQYLKNMDKLYSLKLSDTKVTDEGLAQLSGLKNLRGLGLDGLPDITDAGLKHLAGMRRTLDRLDLSQTSITDKSADELVKLENLAELHLNDTKITNDGVAKLAELKDLKRLGLAGTKIDDKALPSLLQCKQLVDLDLRNTAITDESLAVLEKMPNLEFLNIRGTKITKEGINRLKDAFPKAKIYHDDVAAPEPAQVPPQVLPAGI